MSVFFGKKTKSASSVPLYTTFKYLACFNNRMVPIFRVFSFFIFQIFRQIAIPTFYVCSSFNFIFFSHVLASIFVVFKSFFLFFFRQVAIFVSCLSAQKIFVFLIVFFVFSRYQFFLSLVICQICVLRHFYKYKKERIFFSYAYF